MRFDHGTWPPGVSTADRSTAPTARYVGLFSSTSPEARDAWCGDFARRAMTDYECLGHIIVWIRSVAIRVETHFMVFEKQDQQIKDMRLSTIL